MPDDDRRPQGVSVRALRKSFGGVQALAGVDLEVRPGEVVALLGPNGAGKSTLLRILGTTVLADAGEVSVASFDPATHPRHVRANVGAVLGDERSWYWRLSGRRNLEFFAALHGLGRRAAHQAADRLLAEVGLTEAADRRFDGYSSGMRARLSIARSLLGQPRVLLLDEPTRTLDPVVARDVRRLVREIASRHAVAVLLASHDLHETAAVADGVVVIHRGRVAARPAMPVTAAGLEQVLVEVVDADAAVELGAGEAARG